MTLTTGLAVTGPFEAAVDIAPVGRMRIHPQAAGGAVALETDISLWVAGLAGGQIFARLTGMSMGPTGGAGDNRTAGVAARTLCFIVLGVHAIQSAVGPATAV